VTQGRNVSRQIHESTDTAKLCHGPCEQQGLRARSSRNPRQPRPGALRRRRWKDPQTIVRPPATRATPLAMNQREREIPEEGSRTAGSGVDPAVHVHRGDSTRWTMTQADRSVTTFSGPEAGRHPARGDVTTNGITMENCRSARTTTPGEGSPVYWCTTESEQLSWTTSRPNLQPADTVAARRRRQIACPDSLSSRVEPAQSQSKQMGGADWGLSRGHHAKNTLGRRRACMPCSDRP